MQESGGGSATAAKPCLVCSLCDCANYLALRLAKTNCHKNDAQLPLFLMHTSLSRWEWLWSFCALFVYSIATVPSLAMIYLALSLFPGEWRILSVAIAVPLAIFIVILNVILISGVLHATIRWPDEGEFPADRKGAMLLWTLHAGIVNFIRVPGLLRIVHANPFLRKLHYRLSGAKIHDSSIVAYDAVLIDPFLIEIGANSRIGDFAKLAGHYAILGKFVIKRIRVGKNAVIGGDAIIGPGVVVGDNAVIGARSVVLPNTVIGPGEIWVGAPAHHQVTAHSES